MRPKACRPRATLVLETLEDRRLLTATPVADVFAIPALEDTSTLAAPSTATQTQIVSGSTADDPVLSPDQNSTGAHVSEVGTSASTGQGSAVGSQSVMVSLDSNTRLADGRFSTNRDDPSPTRWIDRGAAFATRSERYWNLDDDRSGDLLASPTRNNPKDAPDFSRPFRDPESLASLDGLLSPTIKNYSQDKSGSSPKGGTLAGRTALLPSDAGTFVSAMDDQEMPAPPVNDREPPDAGPLPPLVVLSEARLDVHDSYYAPAPALPTDLLGGLIPFDAQALERGIQNFLEQFGGAGKAAHAALDSLSVGPVVITVGAAVLALEIYRHRRRPAAHLFPAATRDESTSWTWVPGMSGVEEV